MGGRDNGKGGGGRGVIVAYAVLARTHAKAGMHNKHIDTFYSLSSKVLNAA